MATMVVCTPMAFNILSNLLARLRYALASDDAHHCAVGDRSCSAEHECEQCKLDAQDRFW